jgi:hypothetical protein
MLRLILILVLVFYVLYKLGLFRIFINQARGGFNDNPQKPAGGNVNLDSDPRKPKKKTDIKGGDYIDYEEVK